MSRIKTSNCASCLFWFGSDAIRIQKNPPRRIIFLKEAKAAASQLRSHAGCGGETNEIKRANGFEILLHFLKTIYRFSKPLFSFFS